MLVKCRKCGNKIDRTIAFKTVVGDKNAYYCNEKEWKQHLEEQKLKEERKQKAKEKKEFLNKKKEEEKILREKIYDNVKYIFGYLPVNTALYKEMNELFKAFEYKTILRYLEQEKDYLWDTMRTKEFTSEYGKIRYFSAILKNSIVDFENKYQPENPEPIKCYDENFCEMKYQRKKKKRSLTEIENSI